MGKKKKKLCYSVVAVGQVKGWKVQQFLGGACGSIHVEAFNSNMKTFGVLRASGNLFARNA